MGKMRQMAKSRKTRQKRKNQKAECFKRITNLARYLQERFHGKLNLVISPQQINHWHTGVRLPTLVKDGQSVKAPLFPSRGPEGFNGEQCSKWVEEWILPAHSVNGGNGSDYQEEVRKHKLWQMQKEKGDVEKAIKIKFDQDLLSIGQTINAAITASAEKTFQWCIEDLLNRLNVPAEIKKTILENLPRSCQTAGDKLRNDIEDALNKSSH